jgi:hypothetical protein
VLLTIQKEIQMLDTSLRSTIGKQFDLSMLQYSSGRKPNPEDADLPHPKALPKGKKNPVEIVITEKKRKAKEKRSHQNWKAAQAYFAEKRRVEVLAAFANGPITIHQFSEHTGMQYQHAAMKLVHWKNLGLCQVVGKTQPERGTKKLGQGQHWRPRNLWDMIRPYPEAAPTSATHPDQATQTAKS